MKDKFTKITQNKELDPKAKAKESDKVLLERGKIPIIKDQNIEEIKKLKQKIKEINEAGHKYKKLSVKLIYKNKNLVEKINKFKELQVENVKRLNSHKSFFERKNKLLNNEKKYALEPLVLDILEPIDWIEQTIKLASKKDNPWIKGMELIYTSMRESLKKYGVKKIVIKIGDKPNFNNTEIIEEIVSNKIGKEKIIEIVKDGYMMFDKVIRFAKVKTSK